MLRKIYSVYDQAVEAYAAPVALASDAQARRAFVDHVMKDENIAKFPQDFAIYYVGEFDDSAGVFKPMDIPKMILSGQEAIRIVRTHITQDLVEQETLEEDQLQEKQA